MDLKWGLYCILVKVEVLRFFILFHILTENKSCVSLRCYEYPKRSCHKINISFFCCWTVWLLDNYIKKGNSNFCLKTQTYTAFIRLAGHTFTMNFLYFINWNVCNTPLMYLFSVSDSLSFTAYFYLHRVSVKSKILCWFSEGKILTSFSKVLFLYTVCFFFIQKIGEQVLVFWSTEFCVTLLQSYGLLLWISHLFS